LHGKKLGKEEGEDNRFGMTSCCFGKPVTRMNDVCLNRNDILYATDK